MSFGYTEEICVNKIFEICQCLVVSYLHHRYLYPWGTSLTICFRREISARVCILNSFTSVIRKLKICVTGTLLCSRRITDATLQNWQANGNDTKWQANDTTSNESKWQANGNDISPLNGSNSTDCLAGKCKQQKKAKNHLKSLYRDEIPNFNRSSVLKGSRKKRSFSDIVSSRLSPMVLLS
ncbi:hypothetical protein YC2023_077787 [Brassica napus]